MKHSQNVIPQPACGSLPSLSPQHGFGWGREGEEQKTPKKSQTPEVCVVCVCLESHRALSPRGWFSILLESKLGEQDCPRCPGLSHLFMDPFCSWRGKQRHPREVTLQYPIEKGILHQLGLPLMLFLGLDFGVWVKSPPISIPLPDVLSFIPVGSRDVLVALENFYNLFLGEKTEKHKIPWGCAVGGAPRRGKPLPGIVNIQ